MPEFECGSRESFIDRTVAEIGEPYHDPGEDCLAGRPYNPAEFHDDHERLEDGCALCDTVKADYQRMYGWMAKAVRREMSSDEEAEMEADRELMRDEFHVL